MPTRPFPEAACRRRAGVAASADARPVSVPPVRQPARRRARHRRAARRRLPPRPRRDHRPGPATRRRRCATCPPLAAQAGVAAVRLKDEAGRFGLGSFKALGGAYAVAQLLAAELARRGVAPAATRRRPASPGATRRRPARSPSPAPPTATTAAPWPGARSGSAAAASSSCTQRVSPAARRRHRPPRRRGAPRRRHLRRRGARGRAGGGGREGWFARLRHLLAGLHRRAGRRHAGLPADGRRGGRPVARARRRRMCSCRAASAAPPPRSRCRCAPAMRRAPALDRGRARPRRLPARQRRARHAHRRARRPRHRHGRPCLRRAQPARLGRTGTRRRRLHGDSGRSGGRLHDAAGRRQASSPASPAWPGLAGFLLAAADPAARETLDLTPDSRVLLFSTEGATDPELYRRLVASGRRTRAGAHGPRQESPRTALSRIRYGTFRFRRRLSR